MDGSDMEQRDSEVRNSETKYDEPVAEQPVMANFDDQSEVQQEDDKHHISAEGLDDSIISDKNKASYTGILKDKRKKGNNLIKDNHKQSQERLDSLDSEIEDVIIQNTTVKNQSQQMLKIGKTVESSPSRNFLIANESTKTMLVKKHKGHGRSKSLLKPVSKGGRNSGLQNTFSLYGLTSNASAKQIFGEPS